MYKVNVMKVQVGMPKRLINLLQNSIASFQSVCDQLSVIVVLCDEPSVDIVSATHGTTHSFESEEDRFSD